MNSVNSPIAENKNCLCIEQRDGRFKGTVQQFGKTQVLYVQRHVESRGHVLDPFLFLIERVTSTCIQHFCSPESDKKTGSLA